MQSKYFSFGATLTKTASGNWKVGGVASAFLKDLDGDALCPDAIREAIPGFMAKRGPDGIQGGPIRLNHNFWQRFLNDAIASLRLSQEEQIGMVASISLPLGRVTKIWVDEAGVTRWEGLLSKVNPIAKAIWGMLQEGMVHLGVSVGGSILGVTNGVDSQGRPCNLINKIRLDELSVTDNPAFRLTQGESEDNGAYMLALTKALGAGLSKKNTLEDWLLKTLDSSAPKEFGSGSFGETRTGLSRPIGETSLRPVGRRKVAVQAAQVKTGIGETVKKTDRHGMQGSGSAIATDVFGLTIGQLTKELTKCASMDKGAMGSEGTIKFLTDSTYGLASAMEAPPPELINLVRFLGQFTQFAQQLPHMDDYQAAGTIREMGPDLLKSLGSFEEAFPKELKGTPLRPSGSPQPIAQTILFPQQYEVY